MTAKKSQRVLVFMVDPNWGGPHNIVVQVALGLRGQGYEILVAFSREPGTAEDRYAGTGIKIFRVPVHRIRRYSSHIGNILNNMRNVAGMVSDVRYLRRLIRENDVDIVQVSGVMAIQAGIAAWMERKPVVWQLLGLVTPKLIMAIYMPFIVKVSAAIMSVGKTVAERHYHVIRRAKNLICFIPPVDLDRFRPDPPDRSTTRDVLGLASEDFVVGVVGNHNPAKAHEYFVQVAARCREQGLPFKFLIVGQSPAGSAGWYEKHVINPARNLGLLSDGTLQFVEPDRPIASYMRAMDAFVLTSRTEGMPTVLLEAMATGLPTISHDVGSVSEIMTDKLGRVVPVGAVTSICDLLEAYWFDPALVRSISVAAREHACLEFGVDRCVEKHVAAYELAARSNDTVDTRR